MDDIDPMMREIIERQERKGGFNVTLLESGTKITVETSNSIYHLVVVEGREITILGEMKSTGEIRYPKPVPAIFIGSTWGGTMMKVDWIGEDMRMEIIVGGNVLTTSCVKNAEIEHSNNEWSYSMDWNK